MENHSLAFEKTTLLKPLIKDFISGNLPDEIIENYTLTIENLTKKKEELVNQKINRPLLHSVLQQQNSNAKGCELIQQNINLVLEKSTFFVLCAHQPCLFLGPSFLIYKIISTIKLAIELQLKFPDIHCIPMFWIGSEDHDKEEILTCTINEQSIKWDTNQTGACGAMQLNEIEKNIQIIEKKSANQDWIQLLKKHYKSTATLSEATRNMVNELFQDYGLLVIDQNNAALKSAMNSLFIDELKNSSIDTFITIQNEPIEKFKYHKQSNTREINLFLIEKNGRNRILKKDNQFIVENSGTTFTHSEIEKFVELNSAVISPNVNLRPLMQSILIPTLVFVGGAGELSYWLQQPQLFKHYATVFPLLCLRNSFVHLSSKALKKIHKNNFEYADFFMKTDALKTSKVMNEVEIINVLRQKIDAAFDEISNYVTTIDSTLNGSAAAEKKKINNSIEVLKSKATQALKRNNEQLMSEIDLILNEIFPNKTFQERWHNFGKYYSNQNIAMLLDICTPLKSNIHFYFNH